MNRDCGVEEADEVGLSAATLTADGHSRKVESASVEPDQAVFYARGGLKSCQLTAGCCQLLLSRAGLLLY